MKDKIKKFLIEKKELLIFIGIVVFVFASVIAVAGIALNSGKPSEIIADTPNDPVVVEPDQDEDDGDDPVVVPKPTFTLPVAGEYVVVRSFFDITLDDESLVSDIITNGSKLETSKGISYAKEDDSVFDVMSIYDGQVLDVTLDDLAGATIKIKHSDNIVSTYYSLANVVVSKGDTVKQGQKLASSSTSINDTAASVHVHLEVLVDNKNINPASVFGKTIDDLTLTK